MLKFKLAAASGNWLPTATRFIGWLTPIAACALLAVLNLSSQNNFSRVTRQPMPMSLSNQAAFYGELNARGENSPPAHIFKWTNADASMSNMRFTSFGK